MPRPLVLLVNRSLPLFGFLLLFALFPVRSLAQSPSITDVRSNNVVDYTGAVGQDVKINGSNFGSSQGSSTVTFNGTAATVTTWSATALYTTVPSGATSGDLIVTVGGVASNAVSFTVLPRPNIVTLRDAVNANNFTGAIGQFVKIVGGGFGTSQGSSTVTFNGTAVTTITSWAANAIYTYVPSGASSGNLVVTVGGVGSNTISFSVLAGPNILTVRKNNVDVTSGVVGDALKIMGGGFGASQGSSTVTFNGTTATTITSWAADAVYTNVPSGATSGNLIVTVGGTASNNYSFTVLPTPTISSVTPATGGAGTVVQISGADFGSSQGSSTVKINGTSVGTASTWQSGYISFTMPAGLSSGDLIVTANGVSSSPTSFTVTTTPTIYTVTPTTAGAGDVIQITGCNLGSSQGSNTVKINGTSVGTASTWQQGYISFTMPSGLSSGDLVVRVGGVDSNAESFTVTQPSITSISPSSGAPGLEVTISGSYFGSSQGSVTFNGTAASIDTWNSTQIVVIVPANVTTGNLVATVGGVQLNGGTFTAVAPPTVSSSVFPSANGADWHNTDVAVTYICTPGGLPLASCSSAQTVSSEGVDQIITGGATDVNGDEAEASVTLDVDKTKPSLTISSPEDGDSTSSSSVTVSGTLSDTLSGTSGVTCNGSSTTLSGNSFSCNVSLNVGLNLIVIRGTDVAGNISAVNFHVSRTGTPDTPTTLRITPGEVNLVVGGTQRFTVLDDDGRPRSDATWEVSDTDIATIPDANTPELTAVDEGDVTLTATIGSVTAEAEIHVLAGTSLTDGTVRWSSPAGYTAQRIVQAIPFGDSPELFSIEKFEFGENDATIFVRGLTSDGRQLWVNSVVGGTDVPQNQVLALPDNDGGIITYFKTPYQIFNWLVRLDAKTGQWVWENSSPVPYDNVNPRFALGLDHVYFTEHWPTSDWRGAAVGDVLYSVDLLSGQVKAAYSAIRLRYYCGTGWTHGQSRLSDPIIDSDGSVLAVLSVTQAPSCNLDAKLYLLRIAPDGSTTVTQFRQLSTSANGLVDPRHLIPDGQGEGGVLVSWDDTDLITRVTASGASDYDLEMETDIEEMILGENDVAYATDQHKLVAFDVPSGQVTWSYTAAQGSTVNMIVSAKEEGLAAKVTTSGVETVVRFDDTSQATSDSWSAKALDYYIGDLWLGFPASGGVATGFVAPPVQLSPSAWFMASQRGTQRARPTITVDSFSQTGENQTKITGLLEEILAALPISTFPGASACKAWVESGSGTGELSDLYSQLHPTSPTLVAWGHGVIRESGNIARLIHAATAISDDVPAGVSVVVNDSAAFFNAFLPNGRLYEVGSRQPPFNGNSIQARATILLHEFGHQLQLPDEFFVQNDLGDGVSTHRNDIYVANKCGTMIDKLPSITGLSVSSGPVSTSVTINGTNFGTTSGTVKFNTTDATVTSGNWNPTNIVVQVPSGATTGNVVVTDSNGVPTTGPVFTVPQ